MLPKYRIFKINSLFYFFKICIINKVSPFQFLSLHKTHFDNGYVSKHKLNELIPKKNRLKTSLLDSETPFKTNLIKIEKQHTFPIILKPEWGFSSHGIKKINNKKELIIFLKIIEKNKIDYICQDFCNYEQEYDIFYVFNNEKHKILSITRSDFPKIKGDGINTLHKLIKNSKMKNKQNLYKINKNKLTFIPKNLEDVTLTNTNSTLHNTIYSNEEELLKTDYLKIINNIKEIKEFKINRISIKTNNWKSFLNGDFKIFEMNILFPAQISLFDETLSNKKKKKINITTFTEIIRLIKVNKEKSTIMENLQFYYKNYCYSNKIKRLNKKC